MTWIRIDDGFPYHPKINGLSDGAFRLHITALCYAGMYLTDGYIPSKIVPKLFQNLYENDEKTVQNLKKELRGLVKNGLWIKTKGGYQIHDYLKHQTSKTQAEQEKEANRLRAQRARERKSAQSHAVIPPVTKKKSTEKVTVTPTPTPTPNKDKNIVQTSFELFWNLYPRRDGKKKAQEAFEKALKKTDIETILAGVTRYIAFLKTTTQQTAMGATWLNGERWNDEVLAVGNILPHLRIEDFNGPYCQSCNQTWPCLTESRKSENPF